MKTELSLFLITLFRINMEVAFSWSTGKDSALALQFLLQEKKRPLTLITTVNKSFKRVSMHGLREELLDRQGMAIGIPMRKVYFPRELSMQQYSDIMHAEYRYIKELGANAVVYGDLFLEDLRKYREEELALHQLKAQFPLWGKATDVLAKEIINSGIKAVVTCANARLLGKEFVGVPYDEMFLRALPANVDPCGENGEFHTFVYNAPYFKQPVNFVTGEKVLRSLGVNKDSDGNKIDNAFWYCDFLP